MVTDADLIALTSAVMGEVIGEEKIVDLCDMAVVTGIKVIPTASVRLILDGKEYVAAETGVGPVDAVLKAIQKLTSNIENIRLSEYRLEAITGGSNAVAEVVIKVEDEKGNIVSARAAREDIVMASVEAMINGINKLPAKEPSSRETKSESNLSGRNRRIQRNGCLQVLRQQSQSQFPAKTSETSSNPSKQALFPTVWFQLRTRLKAASTKTTTYSSPMTLKSAVKSQ